MFELLSGHMEHRTEACGHAASIKMEMWQTHSSRSRGACIASQQPAARSLAWQTPALVAESRS